nr:MAG TPA: hypothetical protein [Caudoviricetes sp.]
MTRFVKVYTIAVSKNEKILLSLPLIYDTHLTRKKRK